MGPHEIRLRYLAEDSKSPLGAEDRAALAALLEDCASAGRRFREEVDRRRDCESEARAAREALEVADAEAQAARITLERERARSESEVKRLRALIDRDHTGLAAGLAAVAKVVDGYRWLPAGEWGSYSVEDHTQATLRKEIGWAFDSIREITGRHLGQSGELADAAFRGGDGPAESVDVGGLVLLSRSYSGHVLRGAVEDFTRRLEQLGREYVREVEARARGAAASTKAAVEVERERCAWWTDHVSCFLRAEVPEDAKILDVVQGVVAAIRSGASNDGVPGTIPNTDGSATPPAAAHGQIGSLRNFGSCSGSPRPKVKVKDALSQVAPPPGQVDGRQPGAEGHAVATGDDGKLYLVNHGGMSVWYPAEDLLFCPCRACGPLLDRLRARSIPL